MMDGRFDQQFAELFAASRADEGKNNGPASLWPLAANCILGLAVFASSVVMGCLGEAIRLSKPTST